MAPWSWGKGARDLMNQVIRLVNSVLKAAIWQGAAAVADKYEDWPARLPPSRSVVENPVLPYPRPSSPAPDKKPQERERKSA